MARRSKNTDSTGPADGEGLQVVAEPNDDIRDIRDIRDELPDDLNVEEFVGPYQFPDNARRRTPAAMYLVVGVAMAGAWVATRSADTALVNRGFGWGGLFLVLLGIYGMAAGTRLNVSDVEALSAASAHIGFPVGHASAQLGWRGLLSRPTWRILLYSAENPPKKRGLVLVDGCDRVIVGDMIEENPEDWSKFDNL